MSIANIEHSIRNMQPISEQQLRRLKRSDDIYNLKRILIALTEMRISMREFLNDHVSDERKEEVGFLSEEYEGSYLSAREIELMTERSVILALISSYGQVYTAILKIIELV